jgi:hypothetical protein
LCEFADGRGFADAVDADDHHYVRRNIFGNARFRSDAFARTLSGSKAVRF